VRNKGISVVIPNYNGRQLLEQVLPSVFVALESSGLPYELIISDDASKDASINFLQKAYPQVKLIGNKTNRGFSPTINEGIRCAKYDYVLLMNSDVKLEPGYFKPLLRYFEKPDTFGVMGRIVGWEDDKIQDAAKYPSFHGAKIKTSGNYYLVNPSENDWLYSMYLSGANAFVDREKLLALGGFDELFAPFYVEDFELSLRAWRLGWKCYYEHFAVCRHQVSTSIRSKSSKAFINGIYYRNKMFMHAMHLQGFRKVLWYLQLIPEILIHLFTARMYYFKSLQLFFSSRKKMMVSQQKFLKLSKAENKTLLDVETVVESILDSVKGKEIKRF
jgi:GT2 family glycosyltransferase